MPYAVVRHYQGSSRLIDELAKRAGEVEKLIRGIEGLVSYALVRTADGGYSVSVYQTREGVEESVRQAREYIQQNLGDVGATPPEVLQGETILLLEG